MLLGRDEEVLELFLTENIEKSSVKFTISNDQLLQGYQKAAEKQMEVIGVFHSHPESEAYPSNTDKKFMDINSMAWVIYSGVSREFRAYLSKPEIVEIPITDLKG